MKNLAELYRAIEKLMTINGKKNGREMNCKADLSKIETCFAGFCYLQSRDFNYCL